MTAPKTPGSAVSALKRKTRALAAHRKKIWNIALGIFFFILGVIGILIPVMPQLIFFFLSAIFFSRASKRFRRALRRYRQRHPKVEKAYVAWRRKAREKRRKWIRKLRDERDGLIIGD